MAQRFWVLGNGTWDLTSTAPWSASSGGTGGASIPTAADDVYFDVNSNVGTTNWTVSILTATCASLNINRLDAQLTFNLGTLYTNTLTIYGSINVATTTSIFYTSVSPSWSATTSTNFTATNFIKFAMTATSVTGTTKGTTIYKILGPANQAEPTIFTNIATSRVTLYGTNVAEITSVITTSLSTSLSFISNNGLYLPNIPYRVNENFGESYSSTIKPIPYQFWG